MESKRKKRQVHKGSSERVKAGKPTSAEALIRFNAELVEGLFDSQAWIEIVFPLLQESIASISGRFTNARFYQGSLTRTRENADILRGYQLGLEEFYNRLHDFILARNKLKESKKSEELDKLAPVYNPFMEDADATDHED